MDAFGRQAKNGLGHIAAHRKAGQRKFFRCGIEHGGRHRFHRIVLRQIGDDRVCDGLQMIDLVTPKFGVAKQARQENKRNLAHGPIFVFSSLWGLNVRASRVLGIPP